MTRALYDITPTYIHTSKKYAPMLDLLRSPLICMP